MLLRRRDDLVCQQVVELVSDYLEGALSRKDRRRFEAHLRNCPNCTRVPRSDAGHHQGQWHGRRR